MGTQGKYVICAINITCVGLMHVKWVHDYWTWRSHIIYVVYYIALWGQHLLRVKEITLATWCVTGDENTPTKIEVQCRNQSVVINNNNNNSGVFVFECILNEGVMSVILFSTCTLINDEDDVVDIVVGFRTLKECSCLVPLTTSPL